MTFEEKEKKLAEIAFKKKWAKFLKLCPLEYGWTNSLGKAPACNTKGPKKEVPTKMDAPKKKK